MKIEKEMPENLSAEEFYEDYIQDNDVFSGMPDEGWEYTRKHAGEVYDEALTIRGDEWQAAEAAVRRILHRHGMDGESW